MFEKDISNLAKPHIKGRGFLGSGNEIIETQTYFTQPENDWEFDTTQKLTYNNPVFIEQCKRRGVEIDDTGWVEQHNLDEEKDENLETEEELDEENLFDDEDEEEMFERRISKRREKSNTEHDKDMLKDRMNRMKDRPIERPNKSDETSEPNNKKEINMTNDNGDDIKITMHSKDTSSTSENTMSIEDAEKLIQSPTPNRDRIEAALDKIEGKPKLKLNIDQTKEKPTKIKLNIKQ